MKIISRYKRLSLWNKLAAWGSAASLAGIALALLALSLDHCGPASGKDNPESDFVAAAEQPSHREPLERLALIDVLYDKDKDVRIRTEALGLFVQDEREKPKGTRIDLSHIDLQDADVSNKDVPTVVYVEAERHKNIDLSDTIFYEANLSNADFRYGRLSRSNFWRANLDGTIFMHADLREAKFVKASLQGAYFWAADLENADFAGAQSTSADYGQSSLQKGNFAGADCRGSNFVRAHLRSAHFNGTLLDFAYFENANLEGAHLNGAQLDNADFSKAQLANADLEAIRGWKNIRRIKDANIFQIRNPPDGFIDWALSAGAVEMPTKEFHDYIGKLIEEETARLLERLADEE